MAPEQHGDFRRKSHPKPKKIDVYSFGVVIWSLITRQTPWARLKRECGNDNKRFEKMLKKVVWVDEKRPWEERPIAKLGVSQALKDAVLI